MQPLISLKILDYFNFACAEIPVYQKHVNTLSVIIPDDIAALVIEYKSGRDIGDAFHLPTAKRNDKSAAKTCMTLLPF